MNDGRHKSRPEHVGRIVSSVLRSTGLTARAKERTVLESWADVVGERAAAHTRAVDIADGVLVIEADHAAWRQELTLLFPAIIEKYNARHGEGTVREIRWRRGGTR
jgi:predicted nucleic acid-binding Zn ribbon protein